MKFPFISILFVFLAACSGGSGQDASTGDLQLDITDQNIIQGVWSGFFESDTESDFVTLIVIDSKMYLYATNSSYGQFDRQITYSAVGDYIINKNSGTAELKLYKHETIGTFSDKYNPHGRNYPRDTISIEFDYINNVSITGTFNRISSDFPIEPNSDQGTIDLMAANTHNGIADITELAGGWKYMFKWSDGGRTTQYEYYKEIDDTGLITCKDTGEGLNYVWLPRSYLWSCSLSVIQDDMKIYGFNMIIGSTNNYNGIALSRGQNDLLIIAPDGDEIYLFNGRRGTSNYNESIILRAPNAPSSVVATPGNTENYIEWDAVTDATSYFIYWSTSSGMGKNGNRIRAVTNRYKHTGLINDTTYYYVVTAAGSGGEGIVSDEVISIPFVPLQLPNSPINVQAIVGNGQAIVSWDAVAGASSYNIYWSTFPGIGKDVNKISNVDSPYSNTGLNDGTTYYYVVTALNVIGESNVSSEVQILAESYPVYVIGDNGPAGGKVFYVTDGGVHGMEAAPEDQNNARWGCWGTGIANTYGTEIGAGAQNTQNIVVGCADADIAAKNASNYMLNGFTDWFLPSKDELYQLYLSKGAVGGFTEAYYWSSSAYSGDRVYSQPFYETFDYNYEKNYILKVRAIRAF